MLRVAAADSRVVGLAVWPIDSPRICPSNGIFPGDQLLISQWSRENTVLQAMLVWCGKGGGKSPEAVLLGQRGLSVAGWFGLWSRKSRRDLDAISARTKKCCLGC
jgi:hypothetical protein